MLARIMTDQPATSGFPANCALIEVHVSDLKELFNSFDPTPFHKRDLYPEAEEFIAGWARELRADVPLGLVVHFDRAAPDDAPDIVRAAVRDNFGHRAQESRQRLRLLFRNGRIALLIGLTVVAGSVLAGDLVEAFWPDRRLTGIARESFLIGGWVAMWRPLEIFLYDWWPIRAQARLYARLAAMPVEIRHSGGEF